MTHFGLIVRRECWRLSIRGKLLVLSLLLAVSLATVWEVYPFLTVNHPIRGEVLILEGWIPTYTLSQAADAFRNGHYRKLLIVRSFDVDERKSEAVWSTLTKCGLAASSLEMVYPPAVRKDR